MSRQIKLSVAVAVIVDDNNKVLITQRPLGSDYGGFWEFPGGKVEVDESPKQALVREIKEEVNLQIQTAEKFIVIQDKQGTKHITLYVFLVNHYQGNAALLENQLKLEWCPIDELERFKFPPANKQIIKELHLIYSLF
jgi:8-oxo-dGTP diphosphatase